MPDKLQDIATELGLSVSTISRVVNGKDRIDPHTCQMELKTLDEYVYRPACQAIRGRTYIKGE